ncbi:MAG TPA: hypothetical protein EYQ27_02675 [Gemmatimonadetes bacterium]|nr:hypothetical protein [Gemmatimonadota bacterium]
MRSRQRRKIRSRRAAQVGEQAIARGLGSTVQVQDELSSQALQRAEFRRRLFYCEPKQIRQVLDVRRRALDRVGQAPRGTLGGDASTDLAGRALHSALGKGCEHTPDARFRGTLE